MFEGSKVGNTELANSQYPLRKNKQAVNKSRGLLLIYARLQSKKTKDAVIYSFNVESQFSFDKYF